MMNLNMMVRRFSSLVLFVMAVVGSAFGTSDTELSKTIRQGFSLAGNGNIEIANKYGQVIVNSWAEDSVYVEIEVVAFGRTDEVVEKSINRVDFDFEQTGDFLSLKTVLDRQSGSFKEFLNNIGDASKSIISKDKLIIDYQVYVPLEASIEIINKFGNVYIDELDGKLDLTLSQGNLRAGDLKGSARMDLSFGKSNIKSVENATLTLKANEVDIESGGKISITSSSSEIHFDNVEQLNLDSRNDQLEILEAGRIEGTCRFSTIDNGFTRNGVDLLMDYGELNLYRIEEGFSSVRVEGKSTDLILKFETEAYFEADITARLESLIYPDVQMDLETEYLDEKSKMVHVTGSMGNRRLDKSSVRLNSTGDIRIGFLQIRTQTKREP